MKDKIHPSYGHETTETETKQINENSNRKLKSSKGWAIAQTPEGEKYYYNKKTGDVSWSKPNGATERKTEKEPKQLATLPGSHASTTKVHDQVTMKRATTMRDSSTRTATESSFPDDDIVVSEPNKLADDSIRRKASENKQGNQPKRKKSQLAWATAQDVKGDTYFYYKETGEATWDKPPDYVEVHATVDVLKRREGKHTNVGKTELTRARKVSNSAEPAVIAKAGHVTKDTRCISTDSMLASSKRHTNGSKLARVSHITKSKRGFSDSAVPATTRKGTVFLASRQSYPEARKGAMASSSPTVMTSVRQPASATSVAEQSKAYNERRKARLADYFNGADNVEAPSVPRRGQPHHNRSHKSQSTAIVESRAGQEEEEEINVGAFPHEPTQPAYQEQEIFLPPEEASGETKPSEPMLLEARIVVEPTLVHAEPIPAAKMKGGGEPESFEDEPEKVALNIISRRPFILAVAVLALLVILIPTIILVSRSRESGSDSGIEVIIDLGRASFLRPYTVQTIKKHRASPQGGALQWVQQHPMFDEMPTWRKQQLMALSTLYYAMDGDRWQYEVKHRWLDPNTHECLWGMDIHNQPSLDLADSDWQLNEVTNEVGDFIDFDQQHVCSEQGTYVYLLMRVLNWPSSLIWKS